MLFRSEFTMPLAAYAQMGGHMGQVVSLEQALRSAELKAQVWREENPWPL